MLYMGKHMCQSQASCDDNGHLIHHLGSNKLANKMQQHVCHTSHPQGAWCNHGNTGVRCSCWSFIHRHSRTGRDRFSGEKHRLPERCGICDPAGVEFLSDESMICLVSLCESKSSQIGLVACEEFNTLS